MNCERSRDLIRGCIVKMQSTSGLIGHGNEQCISSVCEPLGTISLFGHNQNYKIYDIQEIIEYPFVKIDLPATKED